MWQGVTHTGAVDPTTLIAALLVITVPRVVPSKCSALPVTNVLLVQKGQPRARLVPGVLLNGATANGAVAIARAQRPDKVTALTAGMEAGVAPTMEGGQSATVVPTDTTVMVVLAAKLRHVANGPQAVTGILKAVAQVTTALRQPTMIKSVAQQERIHLPTRIIARQ